MKAIKCELCGGNELIKDDGVFVCQHCGTKYTLEEARKLMIEGPVTVEGIAGLDNLLLRAKEFERNGDIDRAIEYYNRVLDLDLNHDEAKGAVERLDRIVDQPNLTVTFLPTSSGMTSDNVFLDGNLVFNIKAGQSKQLTVPYGEHQIGTGTFKCKRPVTISINRQSRYQMNITAKTLSTEFQVLRA